MSLSPTEAAKLRPLALAFLGDSVYDLLLRTQLVHSNAPPRMLHRQAQTHARAEAQAAAADALLPHLTPAEQTLFRGAQNAKPPHTPRGIARSVYAKATALEALFGWLWISAQHARANELANFCVPANLALASPGDSFAEQSPAKPKA